jgi:hypothetical protein
MKDVDYTDWPRLKVLWLVRVRVSLLSVLSSREDSTHPVDFNTSWQLRRLLIVPYVTVIEKTDSGFPGYSDNPKVNHRPT